MSQKFLYVGSTGLYFESNGYESTDFINTSAGAGSAGSPIVLDAAGHIDSTMINDADIDHGGISGLGDDDHTQYILATGARALTGKQSYSSAFTLSADTELAHKKYVDDEISGALSSEMTYKGVIDVATPNPDLNAIDNSVGDFYKVSVAGTYLGETWSIGDMLILNKDVASGTTITSADVDKIDNTESSDILREGDLASAQMFVGDGTGTAQAVNVTGDVSISNTGVTSITGDVIVNADINASAAIALSKLASGTSAQVIVCNGSGVPAYVTMSGDITTDNAGATTIGADVVKDSMIDWGVGASQVSAVDMPIADAGGYTTETDVEGALQDLYGQISARGINYTAGLGGVVKGNVVYISSNDTVLPWSTLTTVQRSIGLAFSTESAAATVKVAANDTVVTGVLTAATAGTPYYWNGTALVTAIPSTSGAYVIQAGVAKNATDLHVECRIIKKNV